MAANGGGPPFIKKEEEQSDSNSNSNSNSNSISYSNHHHHHTHIHNGECSNSQFSNNNCKRGISIAERRAAKCGFNASNMNAARFNTAALSQPPPPPLFTIPPSLMSPSALLDSPIMLPNAQAQLSPTTGTFQFPSPNHESLKLKLKLASNGEHAIPIETCSDSSEAPREEVPLSEPNKFMHENKPLEEFEYPRNLQLQQKVECFDTSSRNQHQMMMGIKRERGSSSLHNINPHQKSGGGGGGSSSANNNTTNYNPSKNSEDGFYWRKYGQKHVKGSEYPRSYYKCTNTNCPVTKKVERSHDGHVTEIVYKGSHNHPNPQPLLIKREETTDFAKEAADYAHLERTSSSNFANDFPDPFNSYQPLEFTPAFGVQDPEEASPESVSFNEEDVDDNGECEAKKRKKESSESSAAVARSTREPKVVVQIESEIDILDDGYRWRKYGQKVVKGNPNPRSYYKCTTPGCPVRKHVERAATDIKSVITTYEGKHNHEIPSSKTGNTNNHNSDVASAALTNSAAAASSTTKLGGDALKPPGKQVQDLPLYLDRKPILNYNGLMHSNNFSPDLNFGPSSLYPLPFPPFESFPYGSFLMSTKTYPSSSKLYPMMPDYMQMSSSQMNAPGSSAMPLASTYHYSTTTYAAHHQVPRAQETRAVKPKEEQIRDEDELYDTYLSIPNQGNGSM